jgi:putative membrane protein
MADWFARSFQNEVKKTVAAVEKKTAAEVVVAVRPTSGHYRHIDAYVGAFFALFCLAVFLYHPAEFEFTYLPFELAAAFVVGTVLSMVTPMGRWLSRERTLDAAVKLGASAAFTDSGVYRTKKRTGVLLFVSAFERRFRVIADAGVPLDELEGWDSLQKRFEAATRTLNQKAFLAALSDLGELLAEPLPCAHDDENELGDDVTEAA